MDTERINSKLHDMKTTTRNGGTAPTGKRYDEVFKLDAVSACSSGLRATTPGWFITCV